MLVILFRQGFVLPGIFPGHLDPVITGGDAGHIIAFGYELDSTLGIANAPCRLERGTHELFRQQCDSRSDKGLAIEPDTAADAHKGHVALLKRLQAALDFTDPKHAGLMTAALLIFAIQLPEKIEQG